MFRLIEVRFLEDFAIAQNHYSLTSSMPESETNNSSINHDDSRDDSATHLNFFQSHDHRHDGWPFTSRPPPVPDVQISSRNVGHQRLREPGTSESDLLPRFGSTRLEGRSSFWRGSVFFPAGRKLRRRRNHLEQSVAWSSDWDCRVQRRQTSHRTRRRSHQTDDFSFAGNWRSASQKGYPRFIVLHEDDLLKQFTPYST